MVAYIFGCLLILGGLWILALATGWGVPYLFLIQGLDWLKVHPLESIVGAAVLFLLGLLLLVQPREGTDRTFRTNSKGGEVRISQDALQEIIARSAMVLPGVLHVQSTSGT